MPLEDHGAHPERAARGSHVILSERSERKDRCLPRQLKQPWMDSDPFVATRLRMTRRRYATQDDPPSLRDSG